MQLLRTLTEPGFVVHVGAGRGVGDLHAWHNWNVAEALIIDADSQRTGWAKSELTKLAFAIYVKNSRSPLSS